MKEWRGGAFSNICSVAVSLCFTKPAPTSRSKASWPFHGIKGFLEGKVVGGGIFYLYRDIWFGYVEIGNMIFGNGFSDLSFIKHGLSSCFCMWHRT